MTGFHKRKVERKQHAAERAKEVERQERIEQRRRLREERKLVAQKDLERFHEAMKEVGDHYEDEEEEDDETNSSNNSNMDHQDSSDFSDWEGIQDNKAGGILRKKQQYQDDDGITTVTVEDIEMDTGVNNYVDLRRTEEVLKESLERADYAGRMMEFQQRAVRTTPKKKKFRYLTKSERKQNVNKERSRSKEKRRRGKSY